VRCCRELVKPVSRGPLTAATTGCCLERRILPRCLSCVKPSTRCRTADDPCPVESAVERAVSGRYERSGSGHRKDRSRTCGRYDRAPFCTWGVAEVSVAPQDRERTGTGRRSGTDHAPRTHDIAPSCSGASRPSSPTPSSEATARQPPSTPAGQRPRPPRPRARPTRAPPTGVTRSKNGSRELHQVTSSAGGLPVSDDVERSGQGQTGFAATKVTLD